MISTALLIVTTVALWLFFNLRKFYVEGVADGKADNMLPVEPMQINDPGIRKKIRRSLYVRGYMSGWSAAERQKDEPEPPRIKEVPSDWP
jgi:hypothetical protein